MVVKTWKPVPNFAKGRQGHKAEIIVIHIGEGERHQILSEFLYNEKSSHYCVNRDGTIWQFVADENTAWANGEVVNPTSEIVKSKGGNPNDYSLSIEHEGYANIDLTPKQYEASIWLVKQLCQKWNIPIDRKHIIGHREIKSTKSCPGMINIARIIVSASKPPVTTNTLTPQQKSALVKLLEAFGVNVASIMKWFQ